MDDADMESLGRCYGQVFVPDVDVPVQDNLKKIISQRAFLSGLSTLVCDTSQNGEVIGFCFIEKEEEGSVYINAAGLRKEFRGGGVTTTKIRSRC